MAEKLGYSIISAITKATPVPNGTDKIQTTGDKYANMASNLSPAELFKPGRGRVVVFLHKYKSGDSFDLVSGGKVKLVYNKDNADIIASEDAAKAKGLLFKDSSSNDFYRLNDFAKTKEFGGSGAGGNKGDVSEGIVGAAIAARFINKNQDITPKDIQDVIAAMTGSGTKMDTKYASLNKNPRIVDDVRFFLSLAKANMDALRDPKNWPMFKDLFESSSKYANGKTVKEWSELLYGNNQYNYIEVISDGLGGQKTTKVDVRVVIDNMHSNINISLKAGDVKQFGQIGGVEYEKQHFLWDKAANIDISRIKGKYEKLLADGEAVEAVWASYEFVKDQLNSAFRSADGRKTLLKDLADGILFFATLNEKDVTLVQLSRNEAKVYNFDNVQKALESIPDLKAEIRQSSGKPRMLITDSTGKSLLEFRVKQENKSGGEVYIRNYIEKGPLLGDLLASQA